MAQKTYGYKSKKDFHIFLLCWIAYFSTYVCRLNYSAVIPELQANNVFPDSRIAMVSSVFFICYGLGQFFSGVIGDRVDTRKMIFTGLSVSALCNIGIFFVHSFPVLLSLWALNGIVQSTVWSPVLKIASLNFDEQTRTKYGIDMSTTVPLGTLISYGLSLLTLIFLPWHYVFLTCGLFELAAALIWLFGSRGLCVTKSPKTAEKNAVPTASLRQTVTMLFSSGALLLILPIAIQGTLKDSVTQWVPTFFASAFGSKTTFSLALTMLLPIVNVTGAYFAKAVNKKLHNEVSTSMFFFIIAAGFLLLLRLSGSKSLVLSLLAMAGVTTCMFAVNVMFITLVPLQFAESGRVSTIGGFLNAVAYIGCGALNLPAGKLLERGNGWNALFFLWIALCIAAIVFSAVCAPLWKRFCRKRDREQEHGQ